MFYHRAFQLTFTSEIAFPEWPALEAETLSDVSIRRGAVDPEGLRDPQTQGFGYQGTPTQWWINVPNIARFQISDGNSITIDAEPDVDPDLLRLFLLNAGMGPLLWQRGLFLLHGTAVKFGDSAVAFLGTSGSGKSTLAAGFAERGYPVLCDGLMIVNEQGWVVPSYPGISLWRDSITHLGFKRTQIRPLRPQLEKYAIELPSPFSPDPVRLRAAYVVAPANHREPSVEPIRGMQKVTPLQNHIYRQSPWMGQKTPLSRCAPLAQQIHLARLNRPLDGFHCEASMEKILMHYESLGESLGPQHGQ